MSSSRWRHPEQKGIALPHQWIAGGLRDAEYKEYVLLAWLQKLKSEFRSTRLYPALADIIQKHKELTHLQRELTANRGQGEATAMDFQKMRIVRSSTSKHEPLEDYLQDLIRRALPHLSLAIEEGKALYDLVDSQLQFLPIGVQPFHVSEGYLLVTIGSNNQRQLQAFRYAKSRIVRGKEAFLELKMECVESRRLSRLEQPENVKWSLIGRHKDLPQPATFHAHLDWNAPVRQTVLPIARRKLLQEIATA